MPKHDSVYSINFLLFGLPLLHSWSKWQHNLHWSVDTVGLKSRQTRADSAVASDSFSLVIADGCLPLQSTRSVRMIYTFCLWVKHYSLHETKSTARKMYNGGKDSQFLKTCSSVHSLKDKQCLQCGIESHMSWKRKCSCTNYPSQFSEGKVPLSWSTGL